MPATPKPARAPAPAPTPTPEPAPAAPQAAPEAPTAPARNIFEAVNRVMSEVGYVRKTKAQSLNYTFAGEAALIAALRPAMVEHGIIMTVVDVLDVQYERQKTDKDVSMWSTRLKAIVRFTHAPSGTYLDVCAIGEGRDSGDKSHNKAMTGAYKYALRQTFCIETGDDPDKPPKEARKVDEAQMRADIEKAKAEAARRMAAAKAKPAVEKEAVPQTAQPQAVGALAAQAGAAVAAQRAQAAQQGDAAAVAAARKQSAPATTVLNSPATLLKMVNAATNGHYQGVPHMWNAMREKNKFMTSWPKPDAVREWNDCAQWLIDRVANEVDEGALAAERAGESN